MKIPLSAPDITEADIQAVSAVLRTSRLSLGPQMEEFEQSIARYVGTSHAIAVNSGTSALHLCIRALGISEGDEVIVPSFTFIAVANVLRYERAVPVFIDIDPQTLNLDPARIEEAITPRTRAIIVVHTFGCPAALDEIMEIARRHKLFVLEDACEALGAQFDGRKVGSFGDAGVFGFYPNKQITSGEGGMIVSDNLKVTALARKLRNQGRSESGEWLQHEELGYNYRISELNCALGASQLKRLETILERREAIAREYHRRLESQPDLELPPIALPRRRISWFVYVLSLRERFTASHRDHIVREMASRGIACGRYFAPIHLQPAYRSQPHRCMTLAHTESIAPRTLALPFFNKISVEQIEEVCQTLGEVLRKLRG
ncbi:MAG TPA: DegT/DnrJ/EryC1/StrS family aminotransferase [Candidatus Acidoferrum sp.]|nr:DegT/DnrJ/EryC1/StrS family aminotransferase [Candidatus Acidoferrum sp.]